MREADIEAAVCRYARSKGLLAFKFTSPGRRNVPDRLVLLPGGRSLFIEFKAPGKTPTAGQQREHLRLLSLGHKVFVVDDIERGKRVIDGVLL